MRYAELRKEDKIKKSDFKPVMGYWDYVKRCSKNKDTEKIEAVLIAYNCIVLIGLTTAAVAGVAGLEKLLF